MITIDLERCIGCFNCVSVCPLKVLNAEGDKPAAGAAERCIKCLHCAAACPQNAISLGELEGILPGKTSAFSGSGRESMEGWLMSRRSYRYFRPEPVPRDILAGALRVAAWAPSAKNQHPTKWIIADSEDKVKEIMGRILKYLKETGEFPEILQIYRQGHNMVTGTARTLLIAYAGPDAINAPVDTALALHNADLMLQVQGIGTCWAGYLAKLCNLAPALRDYLGLPEGFRVYGAMMAGYPEKEKYIHIPNRHKQPEIRWL